MRKVRISIIYHSRHGHTEQIARFIEEQLNAPFSDVRSFSIEEAMEAQKFLHASDTIVFGSPTCLGNVSAGFSKFMEWTECFWYKQLWKDKLASGFTVSPTVNGDKLHTLISLSLFAAQHGMLWISQAVLPRFINDEQTDGQNRLGSYLGLMVQSNTSEENFTAHPGDLLTAELFAKRILDITRRLTSHSKIKSYDKNSN